MRSWVLVEMLSKVEIISTNEFECLVEQADRYKNEFYAQRRKERKYGMFL